MRMRILILFVFVLTSTVNPVQGSTCFDYNDRIVIVKENPKLNDIAIAKMEGWNSVIYYNPTIVNSLHTKTRVFFFWHECAHHVLAHTLMNPSIVLEQEADCWAIKHVVSKKLLSTNDVKIVQSQITSFGKHDWTHLPGDKRALNLAKCLKQPFPTATNIAIKKRESEKDPCDDPNPENIKYLFCPDN